MQASRSASYFGPVTDGRSLPRDPFDPDAPPLSSSIPMILGNTRGETRTLIGRGQPRLFDLTWETLQPALEANSPFMGSLDRGAVIASYRRWHPGYSPADVFFAATTDSRSWRGQVIEAERRAAQPGAAARTWVFQFDWPTPVDGGKWGAHHGLDVPFAFDTTDLVPEIVGAGGGAARLAAQMSRTWIEFARRGDPNHPGSAALAGLRPRAPFHHGLRRDDARRRRSARRRAAAVSSGALCPARYVGAAFRRPRAG